MLCNGSMTQARASKFAVAREPDTGPCRGCGRPLTLWERYMFAAPRPRRVMLCDDCGRLERNRLNALRSRVEHEDQVCVQAAKRSSPSAAMPLLLHPLPGGGASGAAGLKHRQRAARRSRHGDVRPVSPSKARRTGLRSNPPETPCHQASLPGRGSAELLSTSPRNVLAAVERPAEPPAADVRPSVRGRSGRRRQAPRSSPATRRFATPPPPMVSGRSEASGRSSTPSPIGCRETGSLPPTWRPTALCRLVRPSH
jgi:hypothetical protein